ncbi:MAG: hypothetical protein H0T51_10255 [Pirellulales bacterium]|nr:hypothetical protein [Pirellulales bacterium]
MLPLVALAMVAWLSTTGYALEIVSIEEHWELSLGQPDAASSSPQVSMVMSPTGHLDGSFFVFTLNHHSYPDWIPGGLQVQFWNGEEIVDSKVGPQEATLQHEDEVITWVQRTSVQDGELTFEITSGQSDSWGAFGGAGHMRFKVATQLGNLNGYRPAVSLEESGVSFAGNRVRSLTLRKLRWTDAEGQVYEMAAPIDVDADLDP